MSELVHVDAYAKANLDERMRYLKTLARAGELLPKAYMGRPTMGPNGMMPAQVEVGKLMLVTELGSSLGLHPASSVTSIHIIDGKPSLSANLVSALVRKAGHKLRVTSRGSIAEGNYAAIAEIIRSDDPDFTYHVEWTMERAQRAGLTGKDNWKKYPEAMLKSRAVTEVVREGAPDVTFFAAYAPEELGANVNEDGEPVELTQVREQAAPAPAAPPRETPIPEQAPAEPEEDFGAKIAALTSRDEALALYQDVKSRGLLDHPIKQGRKKRKLGELLIEVGKAFAEAEKAIEGEIVEDDAPAVLADNDEMIAEEVQYDGE